jgi:hypothetical protein
VLRTTFVMRGNFQLVTTHQQQATQGCSHAFVNIKRFCCR